MNCVNESYETIKLVYILNCVQGRVIAFDRRSLWKITLLMKLTQILYAYWNVETVRKLYIQLDYEIPEHIIQWSN